MIEENIAFALFALVSPLLIAALKQQGWPAAQNALVALVCYVAVGVGGALVSGEELTIENATAFVATAVVLGTAAYQLFWKNWGDPQINARTSVVKGT